MDTIQASLQNQINSNANHHYKNYKKNGNL